MTRYIQSPDTSSILIKPLIHSMRKTLINAVMLESLISPSTVLNLTCPMKNVYLTD